MTASETSIDVLLRELAAPAQRAIQAQNITTLEQLAQKSAREMMTWHGIGKTALTVIMQVLLDYGLEQADSVEE
jgi:DNA-directed RNA polymerase alpha subunit